MNKKLKVGLAIGIPILLIAVSLTLFFVLRDKADDTPKTITLSQYSELKKDMTYEEVVEKLGSEGEAYVADGESKDESLKTYIWYGEADNAKAVITFNNGLLAAKTHVGLT